MEQLIAMKDGRVVAVLSLEGRNATIGRAEESSLRLDHPSVSRTHARLDRDDSAGWSIHDASSTNGLMVDGLLVSTSPLEEGSVVQVGLFTLQFVRFSDSRDAESEDPAAAPASTPETPPQRGGPQKALEALFLLSSEFSTLLSIGDLLEKMIDCLLGIFRAERGFILLYHPRTDELEPAIVRKMDRSGLSDTVSMTVALHAAKERKPVLLDDLTASARFRGARSLEQEKIRSILAAPLIQGKDVLGVVYLDSQLKSRKFESHDLEILETFCRHASSAVQNANEKDRLRRDLFRLKVLEEEQRGEFDAEHIVGESPAMLEVKEQIGQLGSQEVTTLILGESGTGKELVARAIHAASARRDGPFVAVNCMALSPTLVESELFGHEKGAFSGASDRRIGRFEMADAGTLFLDEIGELSQEIQVKLLRVLQEHQFERVGSTRTQDVDVRIVAATNADLKKLIREGKFREDLFYRINVFSLHLSPLRDRRQDIPALAEHFIAHFDSRRHRGITGLAPDAMQALVNYSWPGNIRELRNVIERAFVLERSREITAASLPAELAGFRPSSPRHRQGGSDTPGFAVGERRLGPARDAFEKFFIQQALTRHDLNVTAAAEEMGLARKSLYRKLEAQGIDLARLQTEQEKGERDQILAALRRSGGNVTAAASDLAIPRASLYRKMEAYNIDPRKCL